MLVGAEIPLSKLAFESHQLTPSQCIQIRMSLYGFLYRQHMKALIAKRSQLEAEPTDAARWEQVPTGRTCTQAWAAADIAERRDLLAAEFKAMACRWAVDSPPTGTTPTRTRSSYSAAAASTPPGLHSKFEVRSHRLAMAARTVNPFEPELRSRSSSRALLDPAIGVVNEGLLPRPARAA